MNANERRGTGSVKWDLGPETAIPMWVADMDFPVCRAITDALSERLAHPVFGYTLTPRDYLESVADWQADRAGWQVDPRELTVVPAMMPAIAQAILTFTNRGDRIATFSPVYFPFFAVIERLGRHVVRVPLERERSAGRLRYTIDTDRLDRALPGCSMLLLCSPHNPGGTVWPPGTLAAVAEVSARHGVRVVSDEIHADLTHPGVRPSPWALVGNPGDVTIVSPSKTFNIPGLPTATVWVAGEGPRATYREALAAAKLSEPNLLALVAARAGYREGGAWLESTRERIAANVRVASERLGALAGVEPFDMDATFILWVDARERLGVRDDGEAAWYHGGARTFDAEASASTQFGLHARAKGVRISEGRQFGPEGEGFIRVNVATDEATLEEGLTRLVAAFESATRF